MDKYVLKREEIESLEGTEKTHFLNDTARRVNKSLGDLTGLTGLGFHIIEVPVGCSSTEFHKHYFEDECVYVLDGEADALIGDVSHRVGPGDFIGYRAGGEAHTLINIGASPLRCIVAGQRLDHDVSDYPQKAKRLFRNRGMSWNLVDLGEISEVGGGRK